jgi:hypothetical protein
VFRPVVHTYRLAVMSRFLLLTFLCGQQRKVSAAPHRGNANRPIRIQGKANAKQKTENRKQKTENRKQKTENRKQKTENRKQKTENRKQKTENTRRAWDSSRSAPPCRCASTPSRRGCAGSRSPGRVRQVRMGKACNAPCKSWMRTNNTPRIVAIIRGKILIHVVRSSASPSQVPMSRMVHAAQRLLIANVHYTHGRDSRRRRATGIGGSVARRPRGCRSNDERTRHPCGVALT